MIWPSIPDTFEVLCVRDGAFLGIGSALSLLFVIKTGNDLTPCGSQVHPPFWPARKDSRQLDLAGIKSWIVLGDVVLFASEPEASRRRLSDFERFLETSRLIDPSLLHGDAVVLHYV